jgi:homoserine kinase type II
MGEADGRELIGAGPSAEPRQPEPNLSRVHSELPRVETHQYRSDCHFTARGKKWVAGGKLEITHQSTRSMRFQIKRESPMELVFLLWHVREVQDGDDHELLIGVYKTEQDANAAIERLRQKPGFIDYPNGFQIHPRELNRDGWTEGFVLTTD